MIRAVFMDIDGTVFSHKAGAVPSSTLEAVKQLKEQGILVVGATGRHPWEINNMNMEGFRPDAWVYVNGAFCMDPNGIFGEVPIDPQDLKMVADCASEQDFTLMFMTKDMVYANRYDPAVAKEQEKIHTPYPPVRDLHAVRQQPVYMMIPYAEEKVWDPVYAGAKHLKYTRWTELAMDVFHTNTTKAGGIRSVLERYGIATEEALGIGDGPNDVSMKEVCGLFMVMGNGHDEAKKLADYITESVDEDGLYRGLVHYGLVKEQI